MDTPEKSTITFQMSPIGRVVTDGESRFGLEVFPSFRPALAKLDQFSHLIALWWADQHDNPEARNTLQCQLPYASDQLAGVFACRAEYRPNPIAVSTCKIISIDETNGRIQLEYIDAIDGTPLLDIKPYFPVCDRVREPKTPDWVADWPQWFEDAYLLAF